MTQLFLLTLSLGVLSGCGGYKMSNFEPAADATIFPLVGDTLHFSFDGLENLTFVGGDFDLWDNNVLCQQDAQALVDQVLAVGSIVGRIDLISNNLNCR